MTKTFRIPIGPALLALAAALLPADAVRGQSSTDIHLLELERSGGRLSVTGPPLPVTDRAGYDNQPAFTADGALLYTSIRGGQADIYRYDPDTGRRQRLTRSAESEYSATPMPGAERFSVIRVEADSAQRLWSFDMAGGDARLLVQDVEPVGYQGWLDAGRVAVFVLGDPPTLQLVETATGTARPLARGIGNSIESVPGRLAVSFTQESDDGWLLREYDAELDTVRTLAPMLGPDESHAWLPDGTILTAHGSAVHAYDPEAAAWRSVVDLDSTRLGPLSRLAVSPDGRRLAVVAERPDVRGAAEGQQATVEVDEAFSFASLVIGSLLAMVNPLGALTIFAGLTATHSAGHRRLTALWACVTAATILIVFALFGTVILRFFGITTHAFRIAGGIIFFAIGWDMLQARRSRSKTTPEEELESAEKDEVAVVPLGIPTLAGPGAITTVIALMGQSGGAVEASIVYVGILVVLGITLLALLAGPTLLRWLGQTGVNVFTRIMGLLITVIGVQFVLDGLGAVVAQLTT